MESNSMNSLCLDSFNQHYIWEPHLCSYILQFITFYRFKVFYRMTLPECTSFLGYLDLFQCLVFMNNSINICINSFWCTHMWYIYLHMWLLVFRSSKCCQRVTFLKGCVRVSISSSSTLSHFGGGGSRDFSLWL